MSRCIQILAVLVGSAAIVPNLLATCTVTVSPGSVSVHSGFKQQFSATVSGTGCTQSVTWTSTKGTINTSGLLTAPVVTAQTTLTVTASHNGATGNATVTVTYPTGLSISPGGNYWILPGGTQALTATATYNDSTIADVTWGSPSQQTTYSSSQPTLVLAGTAQVTGSSSPPQPPQFPVPPAAITTAFAGLTSPPSYFTLNPYPPIPGSLFGMHVSGTYCCNNAPNEPDPWPFTNYNGENSAVSGVTFSTWRSLGSGITWAQIDSCTGVYNWNGLDSYVQLAQQYGQSIMFTAWGTPHCITSNPNDGCNGACSHPTDLDQGTDATWKNFIQNLISHVGVGKIKYLEVWNEPNNPVFWSPTETVQHLQQMVVDATEVAKQMDPNILVITPAVTGDPVTSGCSPIDPYLSQLLRGILAPWDYVGFHGYVSLPSGTGSDPAAYATCVGNLISAVQSVVQSVYPGGPTRPIFDTEGSWLKHDNANIYQNSDEEAAVTGIQYLMRAGYMGSTACPPPGPNPCYPLAGFNWYGWDFAGGSGVGTGVLWDPQGLQCCAPGFTAAGVAYQHLYKWLLGAAPSGPCTAGPSGQVGNGNNTVWTCNFTRLNGATNNYAEAVWDTYQTCLSGCSTFPQSYPSWAVKYVNLTDGTVTNLSGGTVPVGLKPILLESVGMP